MGDNTTAVKPHFTIREEVVIVKPVKRKTGLIESTDHAAAHLFGEAEMALVLTPNKNGVLKNPFLGKTAEAKAEEKKWLETSLGVNLNYQLRMEDDDNYLATYEVKLGNTDLPLDLSSPADYLKYIILLQNRVRVAPEKTKVRKSQMWKIVSESHVEDEKARSTADNVSLWIAVGDLMSSKSKMTNFLKVMGHKVSMETKEEFMVGKLRDLADNQSAKFMKVYNDKDNYEMKLLLANAVAYEIIKKDGNKYMTEAGAHLWEVGDVPSISATMDYLNDPENQETLTTIKARVENAKE